MLRRPPARPVPWIEVTLVDVDMSRAEVAAALGAGFARPEDAAGDCDLVVHASATSAGLQRSLDLLAPEGMVLDLSWYGDADVRLSLGGAFHTDRLGLRASQVGTVSPARSARRTRADRLALALDLLRDPASIWSSQASRASTSCPASWRAWPRGACRRSATPSPTTRRSACSA